MTYCIFDHDHQDQYSMTKFKKIAIRIFIILLILTPVAAIAHYVIFPQETRCILVGFSGLKKQNNIYFDKNIPQQKIDSIQSLIEKATDRIKELWGEKKCTPTFIYCNTEELFKKYGADNNAPAVTHFKLGAYIVLQKHAIDLDIIAHEMCHAELGERTGFYAITFKIPVWFNEGLAMQNDNRPYFSEDSLKTKTNGLQNMPVIKNAKTAVQFYGVTQEEVDINFMAAKHEVKNWYTKMKLDQLVKDMHSGKSFDEAYGSLDQSKKK